MRILAVDDEQLQLDKLTEAIRANLPEEEIVSTRRPSQALYFAEEQNFDVAFVDVQMRGMTGVELAEMLIRLHPHINIIFVTAYNEYKGDAMDLRASGYITKPVNAAKIRAELQNLRYPVQTAEESTEQEKATEAAEAEEEKTPLLYVQCFGNFDVFDAEHRPVRFERSKAKDMLAYLVYRRGTRCTNREITDVLFEDEKYGPRVLDSFRHVTSALLKGLRGIEAEEVVIKEHQNYSLDTSRISCDYYDFLDGDPDARNRYTGDFMAQYSWAEYTHAYLDSLVSR